MKKINIFIVIIAIALSCASCNRVPRVVNGAKSISEKIGQAGKEVKESGVIKKAGETYNVVQTYNSIDVECSACNGTGRVACLDKNGNIIKDMFGNPKTVECPKCGGDGKVL